MYAQAGPICILVQCANSDKLISTWTTYPDGDGLAKSYRPSA
jgi:hypothetical protein